MSPIEQNASLLLIKLVVDDQAINKVYSGQQIRVLTDLSVTDINDAIEILIDKSQVQKMDAYKRQPYNFGYIRITAKGRIAYHDLKNKESNPQAQSNEDFDIASIKIFISYESAESELAKIIKDNLDYFEFTTFLAHEDIQPTQDWLDTLYAKIEENDIFFVLLTKGIIESPWCNQEIGIALAKNKLIIPIKIEQDPPGFISKYQALKYSRNEKFPIAKLLSVIYQNENLSPRIGDFLINMLANSRSFIHAEENANIITEFNKFTIPQLNQIMQVSIKNNQIYYGTKAKKNLLAYMWERKEKTDKAIYEEFKKRLSG